VRHKLKISSPDGFGHNTSVQLDGKTLENVQVIDVHIDANELVTATVKFTYVELEYDGEAETVCPKCRTSGCLEDKALDF
jgi:hypothetical protein